jgi:hypothetical protein
MTHDATIVRERQETDRKCRNSQSFQKPVTAGFIVPAHTSEKGPAMASHANGSFEVKLNPQPPVENIGDPTVGRLSIDKRFSGDLEATSKGEMLAAGTDVKGSAGYVAIERVTGALHGRNGSFALLHRGIMTRGTPELTITVVPDSGTGQLIGLAGKMSINIVEGKHSYDFEYTIEEAS